MEGERRERRGEGRSEEGDEGRRKGGKRRETRGRGGGEEIMRNAA